MPDESAQGDSAQEEKIQELLALTDAQLLRRVKADLVRHLPAHFVLQRLPTLRRPSPASLAGFITSETARLKFTEAFMVSTPQSAPGVALEYLGVFKDKLFEEICIKLDYCANKKRFADFFKDKLKDLAIDPEKWEQLRKWIVGLHLTLGMVLHYWLPLSLLIYFIKKALDKLCGCKGW